MQTEKQQLVNICFGFFLNITTEMYCHVLIVSLFFFFPTAYPSPLPFSLSELLLYHQMEMQLFSRNLCNKEIVEFVLNAEK